MGELANVIFAVAALITSVGGALAAVVTALRAGNRERQRAATDAVTQVVAPPSGDRVAELEAEIKRLREDGP